MRPIHKVIFINALINNWPINTTCFGSNEPPST